MGLAEARAFAESKGTHVTIMIGVVAEHDSEMAESVLDDLTAWVMAHHEMPLLINAMSDDCLVAPPERGSAHVEIRWLSV